jgi:tRNA(fMet)-specific endonuclease VapC
VLHRPEHSQYATLSANLNRSPDQTIVATAVSIEEQMRGWLAAIRRTRRAHEQVLYYARLIELVEFFSDWEIIPFDKRAADRFEVLRKQRIRIGTQDLKIASIALETVALLLSANLRDFEQVPGLRVENWLS